MLLYENREGRYMVLQRISTDNFIDTTNQKNIEIFEENLKQLVDETRKNGFVDKLVIIRNDSFFPTNYEWLLNCKYTNGEYRKLVTWKKERIYWI